MYKFQTESATQKENILNQFYEDIMTNVSSVTLHPKPRDRYIYGTISKSVSICIVINWNRLERNFFFKLTVGWIEGHVLKLCENILLGNYLSYNLFKTNIFLVNHRNQ